MATNLPITNRDVAGKGFQRLTSLAASSTLTVPAGANCAVLQAETNSVRLTLDGTTPTATVGMILKTTDEPLVIHGDLSAIKVIETTASAQLSVTYLSV